MQSSDYWRQFTDSRLSRRRAVLGAGGVTLGAAFLAACGGGSSSSKDTKETKSTSKSGLVYEPVDSTSQAKPGGVIKTVYTADVLHFDALASNSSSVVNDLAPFTYPRMVKFGVTKYPKPHDGTVEGDAMESFEISPDRLTVTFKVRQGMNWDAKAPTSSRPLDAQDVLFSWGKFSKVNPSAPNLAYDATKSPGAAIESMSSPDAKTVVVKLKQPDAALLTLLAGWDQLYLMPRESDGGFDPKNEIRGYGPWLLEDYRASAYTYWRKNPDYYVKGRPYPDRMERALVPELAARLAQFRAGNIHTDVVEQAQDNVVQLKKDVPQALLTLGAGSYGKNYSAVISTMIIFGYEGNSVFKDVRMRQALSMAIDREALADTIDNRANFAKDGLDNSVVYNSSLSPAWNGYWLDPKNEKEFGPNAKYYKYDVPEAKKLIAAAGFPNGADFDFFNNREETYGPAYRKMLEIYTSMLPDAGLRPRLQPQAYAVWQPQYYIGYLPATFNSGQTKGFNGIGLSAERSRYTAVLSLYGMFHPQGDAFHGATADGNNAVKGDPKLNDQLAKLRLETDKNKAQEGVKDVQRYLAQQAYIIPKPTNSIPFTLWWPSIGNAMAYTSSPVGANRWAEQNLQWWIDQSKPPLTKT